MDMSFRDFCLYFTGMNTKNLSKKWCQKNGIAVVESSEESTGECAESLKIAVPNANDEILRKNPLCHTATHYT